MPKPREGRYGKAILTTPYGSYFWLQGLGIISFLPDGVQRAREMYHLMEKHNIEPHAVRFAAKMAERHAQAVLEGRGNFADWPMVN